jgi:hypothetical protein
VRHAGSRLVAPRRNRVHAGPVSISPKLLRVIASSAPSHYYRVQIVAFSGSAGMRLSGLFGTLDERVDRVNRTV